MEQLRKILKSARLAAQRCDYREAIDLFDEVLDSVQQHLTLQHLNDRKAIDDWHNFQYYVETEKARVQNAQYNHAFEQRKKFIKDVDSGEPQRTKYDNFAEGNTKPARNYSMTKKKDPLVWDPPSPKAIKRVGGKPDIPSAKNIVRSKEQRELPKQRLPPREAQPLRDVKDMKKDMQKPPGKQQMEKPVEQKSFLLARYPNGQGPDTNLI
jgi:hypothetical protein